MKQDSVHVTAVTVFAFVAGAFMVGCGISGALQILRCSRWFLHARDSLPHDMALSKLTMIHSIFLVTVLCEQVVIGGVVLYLTFRKLRKHKDGLTQKEGAHPKI
jgi:hypothetical protein